MHTEFQLIFEDEEVTIDLPLFRNSLPPTFDVREKANGIYISLDSSRPEDENCQALIDRELDRYFFLTSVKIKAIMVRRVLSRTHTTKWSIYGGLNRNIQPQKWNYELPIQLRLWAIAIETNEIILQVILFYQIIELAYPDNNDYPAYTDASKPPEPLTECRLLRHLAAHSGSVTNPGLKRYCEYLKLPKTMHNPTDPAYAETFRRKLDLLQREAAHAIEKTL